jgi:hypothetical protein
MNGTLTITKLGNITGHSIFTFNFVYFEIGCITMANKIVIGIRLAYATDISLVKRICCRYFVAVFLRQIPQFFFLLRLSLLDFQ